MNRSEKPLSMEGGQSFVVQYHRGANGFVQTIMKQKHILFPFKNVIVGRNIFIKNEENRQKAIIIKSDTEKNCSKFFFELKRKCESFIFKSMEKSPEGIPMEVEPFNWFLVNFSPRAETISYAIINTDDIQWRGKGYNTPFINEKGELYAISLLKCSNSLEFLQKVFQGLSKLNTNTAAATGDRLDKEFQKEDDKVVEFYHQYLHSKESEEISKTLNDLQINKEN